MRSVPWNRATTAQRIDAALGKTPCDLVIRGVQYLDVFSCQWRTGDVAIHSGAVIALEAGLKARREIDGRGKWLTPGLIDAHVHVESSLLTPERFEAAVLPRGTTTAICDPHELANVQGTRGIETFLQAAEKMALDLRVMLSSCVPATHLETNGGGTIGAQDLLRFKSHPQALGLAEMMNFPGLLNADPDILDKLEAFADRPMDGHAPMLRGAALSAYAACGISSCHESSNLEEAREKLIKGMSVWIREGSVAKDLHTLLPLLDRASSVSIGFCTDDRNPLDIADEGHVDHLVREALRTGVDPTVALRSASWSVARHYGLGRVGAIAPGYQADLLLLDDLGHFSIGGVLKCGVPVGELQLSQGAATRWDNSINASVPEDTDLHGPSGQVHAIEVLPGKILTGRSVVAHDAPGVAHISVLERHHGRTKPANGYVTGFGTEFRGAIASSVGHDSHNLIVVGSSASEMRVALAALIELGGGFCVVQDGHVLASLALPFAGLMSGQDSEQLVPQLRALRAASKQVGCQLAEPFLQLAFLSLPVIPSLKITDLGLVDVDQFKIIDVRAS